MAVRLASWPIHRPAPGDGLVERMLEAGVQVAHSVVSSCALKSALPIGSRSSSISPSPLMSIGACAVFDAVAQVMAECRRWRSCRGHAGRRRRRRGRPRVRSRCAVSPATKSAGGTGAQSAVKTSTLMSFPVGHCRRGAAYAGTCSPRLVDRRLHAARRAGCQRLERHSTTLSVPSIIGALTCPIWAMRNALPDISPMPWPSTTPHFSLQ